MNTPNLRDQIDRAKSDVESATVILEDAERLIRTTLFHFELELADEVIRYRPRTPVAFREAQEMVLFGKNCLESVNFDGHPAPDNRSRRIMLMADLVRAFVRAQMGLVYVDFWKESKAMRDFAVLAHQASAYSLAALSNWEFFAPLVFVHDHEPIDERNKVNLYHIMECASAGLAYGLCLNAQMNVLPNRLHKKYEQERAPKPEGNRLSPARWPQLTSWAKGTQAEIAEEHCHAVGQERHEKVWLGQHPRGTLNPKARLAGFDTSRGGRNKRKASAKA